MKHETKSSWNLNFNMTEKSIYLELENLLYNERLMHRFYNSEGNKNVKLKRLDSKVLWRLVFLNDTNENWWLYIFPSRFKVMEWFVCVCLRRLSFSVWKTIEKNNANKWILERIFAFKGQLEVNLLQSSIY